LFQLIFANINRYRLFSVLIGVLFAIFTFYLVIGLNASFSISASLRDAVADNMTGDIILAPIDARKIDILAKEGERELVLMNSWKTILTYCKQCKEVTAACPRLRVWGMCTSNFNNGPLILTGVDPLEEQKLLPHRFLDEGTFVDSDNQICLYYRHSDFLNANVGDSLGITIPTAAEGYDNFEVVTLKGILDYKDIGYYSEFAIHGIVGLHFLQNMLQLDSLSAGEIFIKLSDKRYSAGFKSDILEKFGKEIRVIEPQNSSVLVKGINTLTQVSICLVAFILLLMVLICSSFLVRVTIDARKKEIGIYQALGVSVVRIGSLIGGEIALVSGFATLLGVSGGLLFLRYFAKEGIEATIIPLQLIFGRERLLITNHPETFIAVAIVFVVTIVFNTVNALYRLSTFDPVEVMRDL
jgi:ABC-type lipoprotein release transport system permease subunit